ncbi:hypothetical protein GXM_03236 [Nostoc sphaeroides CCNUC1]|uniref:Uncharacterized protein n=1 Tax=Nostoc sphaeroides CCNUC1 TaxID=2653204 RepID=A0A5P8W163_9NOSO|nr:hypothetical protein GXM_03236 [Nostoc sphaeroides CCNUC1]
MGICHLSFVICSSLPHSLTPSSPSSPTPHSPLPIPHAQ